MGRAVLLGNIGAIMGGVLSVRLMGHFGKQKYGEDAYVVPANDEGYDLMRFREIRPGNAMQRVLQSLLDGGVHGVKTGLNIMPGIIVITTAVMMLAYGPGLDGYTGGLHEGIGFFPWVGAQLSFLIEPVFGFTSPEAIAFPVTSLGSVGASLAMVPQFLQSGIIDANGICVYTAIGICNAGFLSTHVGMMDGIGERSLTSVAIASHGVGGLFAGFSGHMLFMVFG